MFAQSYEPDNFQTVRTILVVDNGSKQNERAIVLEFQQQHPNIRYIRVPNPSLYGAWNCALKLARGRYWANANTDDSMRNDALEVLAAAMEKTPGLRPRLLR